MGKRPKQDDVSRRAFLHRAGIGGTASLLLASPNALSRQSQLQSSGRQERISENLWLFEDTCNVYLVRHQGRGLLIDFGSGHILNFLNELGISRIDWILHTRHHRDQAQGDRRAVSERIPIAVPRHERHLFESAETSGETGAFLNSAKSKTISSR